MRKLVNRFKKLKNERGLTLVELLAVIVILAIIAIIAFVFIGGVIENSRKDAHIANAQQIISAAKLHEATGGDLTKGVTVQELINKKYLDSVINPWNKEQDPYKPNARITKNNNDEFVLKGFSVKGKCDGKFADKDGVTETEINTADRDTLCKSESE